MARDGTSTKADKGQGGRAGGAGGSVTVAPRGGGEAAREERADVYQRGTDRIGGVRGGGVGRELGAAFLCAALRPAAEPRPDHAQYVASWLKVLRGDKRAIFTAAA